MPRGIYERKLPIYQRAKSTLERFWSKVEKTETCWEWTASTSHGGYGFIGIGRKGKVRYAHRYSWIIHFGKIPKGLLVLHKCDNPPCVNPNHLFLGTQKDNMIDAVLKKRIATGEKNGRSKLTENKVDAIRKMYAAGNITMDVLSRLFGVNRQSIGHVINNKTWKNYGR